MSGVSAPQRPFFVRLPRAFARKVAHVVRLIVGATAGLAGLLALLVVLDATLLGDSRRES